MFTENDFMTPRERVNEALRQRMLESQNGAHLGCDRGDERGGSCCERGSQRYDNSCGERDSQRYDNSCGGRRDGCSSGEGRYDSHSGRKSWGLEEYPLASVFAPLQCWRNLYDAEVGLSRGTIFKELDLPFLCGERKGGNCRGR